MQIKNGDEESLNMNVRYLFAAVAALIVTACVASITEVVPAGKDTYVVAGDDTLEGTSGASIKTTLKKKGKCTL